MRTGLLMQQDRLGAIRVENEAQERAINTWLRDEVVPATEALMADPSRALPIGEARARLLGPRESKA